MVVANKTSSPELAARNAARTANGIPDTGSRLFRGSLTESVLAWRITRTFNCLLLEIDLSHRRFAVADSFRGTATSRQNEVSKDNT